MVLLIANFTSREKAALKAVTLDLFFFSFILLYACKLAFLALSTCVKIIEFSLTNEARKAYLHTYKRIIIIPTIMKEVYVKKTMILSCDILFPEQS